MCLLPVGKKFRSPNLCFSQHPVTNLGPMDSRPDGAQLIGAQSAVGKATR